MSETGPVVTMYWRPGCGFCSALKRGLDQRGIVYEQRNIWDNAEDAAFVRSVARGNETVPTVTVGEVSMVNPSADQVEAAMASAL
jgi:mycoredoxin